MQSRLISKKQDIEAELKRGVRDPRRKQYLTARLLQIDRDISSMGFSPEEVKKNEFTYVPNKTLISKQYYVPLPSWIANDKK
jgi:hypothetical protein